MVKIKRRILELFDGKQSLFFPQIQTVKGDWISVTGDGGREIAFENMDNAQGFLSKMPKQMFQIHEYVSPVEVLKTAGDA